MSFDDTNRRKMGRRRLLQALGAVGIVGLAGCSGDEGDGSDSSDGESGDGVTGNGQSTASSSSDSDSGQTGNAGGTVTESSGQTAAGESQETASGGSEQATEDVDVANLETQVSDLSFEGKLFDTHAHWAGAEDAGHTRLDPETFATRMKENGVGACVLFTSSVDAAQNYQSILKQLATPEVDYVPFLQPMNFEHLVKGKVTNLHEKRGTAFVGIGEIIFYGGPMRGTSLTSEPWPKLFEYAAANDVPLMIHPTQAQEEGLKTMLSKYPEAAVMAHGGEFNLSLETLRPLLTNHDNLYWTVDAGSMLNGLVLRASGASEFASRYDQQKGEFKRLVKQILPPIVDAAPNRVMWGTDLATDWNTDPKVYSRVMDWTQAALDSLPAEQRDKYAYKNAKRLFGL